MFEIIIISIAARALATSAKQAGYRVNVIDYFADTDTQQVAKSVHQLQLKNDDFIEEELISKIEQILISSPDAKLVLGSGFESKPELIDKLTSLAPTFSNTKETVYLVKKPSTFYGILKKHSISYPETLYERPDFEKRYLIKKIAGHGGEHINWLSKAASSLDKQYYFQEYIPGEVCSAVFLANGSRAKIIGFNLQLQTDQFADMPFLFQGAIRLNYNSIKAKQVIENIINIIVTESGLKGLCGLDYIINDSGEPVVLEVNPRPPASYELHEEQKSLFDVHLASFDGKLEHIPKQKDENRAYKGYIILYAKETIVINDSIKWPDWVKDKPEVKSVIKARFPVCTVHAEENSLDKVKVILFNRLSQIETMIAASQGSV